MNEITIPYERFEELIRAEIKLEMMISGEFRIEEESEVIEFSNKVGHDKEYVKRILIDVFSDVLKGTDRVGNEFLKDGELVGLIKGNEFHLLAGKFKDFSSDHSHVSQWGKTLKENGFTRNLDKRHNFKTIRYRGVAMKTLPFDPIVVQSLGFFNEIFKYDKVDRDQFAHH